MTPISPHVLSEFPVQGPTEEDDDGGLFPLLLTIMGVIVALILLVLLVILACTYCKRRNTGRISVASTSDTGFSRPRHVIPRTAWLPWSPDGKQSSLIARPPVMDGLGRQPHDGLARVSRLTASLRLDNDISYCTGGI